MPFPSPGDLPNPGIEPRSPALQADALLSEPPGKLWGHYILAVSLFPLFKPMGEQELLDGICISSSILDTSVFSDRSITFCFWGNITWVPPPCRHRHVLTQIVKFLPVPTITWEMKMIKLVLQMWSRKVKQLAQDNTARSLLNYDIDPDLQMQRPRTLSLSCRYLKMEYIQRRLHRFKILQMLTEAKSYGLHFSLLILM